jgi:hypothetical protein
MALPNKIISTVPAGSDAPSVIDDRIKDLALGVIDILGIPDNTNISAAGLNFAAAGLQYVLFQDAAANPAAAGRLQRNAANLLFHDGTAARTFVSTDGTQTLTNKTLSAPVLSGTATGTYTLGGTPTINSPTISSPTLSGTATGTYTLGGTPTISSPTLSGTVAGTYTIGGTPTLGATLNLNSQTLSGAATFSGALTLSAAGTALTVNNNATISGTSTLGTTVVSSAADSPMDITSTLATSGAQLKITGSASSNGVNLKLVGDGATTPTKYIRVQGGQLEVLNDTYATILTRIIEAPADGKTCLSVYRNVGGTSALHEVTMGAVDSGGPGFKLLRVPN